MYQHVFWDLGGTLVDTYPALDEALAAVIERHGIEANPAEVSRLTRRSTGEAIATLSQRHGIDADEFEQAHAALKEQWKQHPAPVMPGAREIMAMIHERGGLNLVVTHRDRTSAQHLIAALDLTVDDLISTSDGHPRKPDPEMYEVLLERHDLDPEDCLAVGDRALDSQAAQAVGIRAATIASSQMPVDDDSCFSITCLDELRSMLDLS